MNVAVLAFDLDAGVPPPLLREVRRYQPPASSVLVAGVATDPTLANGYLAVVAIADFGGADLPARPVTAARAGAVITADQGFSIAFAGDAGHAAGELTSDQALTQHGPWGLIWDRAGSPGGPTGGPPPPVLDGTRLLDEVLAEVRGAASPTLVAALSGQPPPAGGTAPAAGPAAVPAGVATHPPGVAGGRGPLDARTAGNPGRAVLAAPPASSLASPSAGPGAGTAPSPEPSPAPQAGSPPGTEPAPSPTPAPAALPPAASVVAGTASVQLTPGAASSVTVACPAGTVLTGGGAIADAAAGEASAGGLVLADAGPGPATADAAGDASAWDVAPQVRSQPVAAELRALAVCMANGPVTNLAVGAQVAGPSPGAPVTATATCPDGQVAIGGGGSATADPQTSPTGAWLGLAASYPSDAQGNPAASDPSSWSVTAVSGAISPLNAVTTAYVLCFRAGRVPVIQVMAAGAPAAASPGTPAVAVASCPAGSLLVSGGFRAGGDRAGSGPGVRASYPSLLSGVPVLDGPAGSWTAIAEADAGTTAAVPSALALCAG